MRLRLIRLKSKAAKAKRAWQSTSYCDYANDSCPLSVLNQPD